MLRISDLGRSWQLSKSNEAPSEPFAVGPRPADLALDLVVGHDASQLGVDEEHSPRLQAALLNHGFDRELEHPDLGRHHDEPV